MKRLALLLLALLLIACTAVEGDAVKIVGQGDNATAAPADSGKDASAQDNTTAAPDGTTETAPASQPAEQLPLFFEYYDSFDPEELSYENWPTEGVMFTYDFDGDGKAEDISYKIIEESSDIEISVGDKRYVLDAVDLIGAILIDLDPASPFINLLVVFDESSDDYTTAEFHMENGELVQGQFVYAGCSYSDGKLYFSERSDVLGTNYGTRPRSGDDLHPDGEWLELSYIPTQEELEDEEELFSLLEMGIVLEVIRDLPCEIDGVSDILTPGVCLYPIRIKADDTAVECKTLSGETVTLVCDEDAEWGFTINGEDQDYYFSNIAYFD